MTYTNEQIQEALQRAEAAGDIAAVEDLRGRLAQNAQTDNSMAWMENYRPEVNAAEAALIGAGRTVDKFVTGVTDLVADDEQQAAAATRQRAADQEYEKLQSEHPVATTVGEVAGYAPTAMIPGGAAVQIGVGGATGAAMYNEPGQRLKEGAVDAAITAVPFGAGKVLKRTFGAAQDSRLVQRANDLDWNLTPGEQLNSPGLRNFEAGLESFPPTAGPLRKAKGARQEAMNRTALEAIGEAGDSFADDALLSARSSIGEVFDEVITANNFKLDDAFLDALGEAEGVARRGLLGGGDTTKIIDNVLKMGADGAISGSELQAWRTTLQTAAKQAHRSDTATREYADALSSMVDAIDDLVERNISPEDLIEWKNAKSQWAAIKQLEKAKAIRETGDVSGRKLANNLMANDVHGYYRGANKSDLYDAARLSKAYPPLPDSGTAARLSTPAMLAATVASGGTAPLVMGAANLAARAYTNPEATARVGSAVARAAIDHEDYNAMMARLLRGE